MGEKVTDNPAQVEVGDIVAYSIGEGSLPISGQWTVVEIDPIQTRGRFVQIERGGERKYIPLWWLIKQDKGIIR